MPTTVTCAKALLPRMRCSVATDRSYQLRAIARALNAPVESFLDASESASDLTAAVELMRCWQRITDASGRERLLQLAQELSDQGRGGRLAAE